jgi:hypothetical protein
VKNSARSALRSRAELLKTDCIAYMLNDFAGCFQNSARATFRTSIFRDKHHADSGAGDHSDAHSAHKNHI